MKNKVEPITPNDITSLREKFIPDEIFQAVNELIVEKWNGSEARFTTNEVAKRYVNLKCIAITALASSNPLTQQTGTGEVFVKPTAAQIESEAYEKRYFDFEEIYRKAGWKVVFDKASYRDTYDDFVFSKKKSALRS